MGSGLSVSRLHGCEDLQSDGFEFRCLSFLPHPPSVMQKRQGIVFCTTRERKREREGTSFRPTKSLSSTVLRRKAANRRSQEETTRYRSMCCHAREGL